MVTQGKTLLEIVRDKEPRSRKWFDKLPPEMRAQLVELREAYHSGELPGWTVTDLYNGIVKSAIGEAVGIREMHRFMQKDLYE